MIKKNEVFYECLESETVYSTTEVLEPTNGVLICKQRLDQLKLKNLEIKNENDHKLSHYRRQLNSSSSFPKLFFPETIVKDNNRGLIICCFKLKKNEIKSFLL